MRARWVVAALLLSACAPSREAELLEVREVSPERVEPGHLLRVEGTGFPPGRDARLRIEGRLHAPGVAPREVAVELDGYASSGEDVEARFTAQALGALGGRGTLHGRVTVVFEAGAGAVIGRSPPMVLDVTPSSTERLAGELARRRKGAALAAQLGIALGEEAADARGLPVESVAPGSLADRAGLSTGDRLLSLEHVRLHALSDFVPPPERPRAEAKVAREGEALPFVVVLPVKEERAGLSRDELLAAQAALGWALLVLLLLAPSAWVTEALARRPRALVQTERRGLSAALARHGAAALRLSVGAAFLATLVSLDAAGHLRVPLETLALAAIALRSSDAFLAARGEGASVLAGLGRSVTALGPVALLVIALGGVAALGGTSDLSALVAAQGSAPWEWTALRTPAGPLLAGLMIVAGAWGRRVRSRFGRSIDDALTLALAGALAATLLGGWTLGETGWARALGTAAFIAKGLVCWTAMRRAGAIAWRIRGKIVIGALGLASAALTAGWILWAPGPDVAHALAEVLTATLAVVLVWLAVRRIAGIVPHHAPAPPHPFL